MIQSRDGAFLPYGRTPSAADNARDLGTSTQRWRTLYLGTSLILQGATYKHTLAPATPSANRTITFPDASGTVALLGASQSFTEAVTVAPAAGTSGVRTALTVTGAADTGRTASTEQSDLYVNLGRTVTWATGAITNQRFTRFAAPTIAFVGASTVTNAATVYIDNAPQAGANATLTNAYALWVDAGATRLDGAVTMGSTLDVTGAVGMSAALTSTIDDATTNGVTRGLTLSHTTTGTADVGIGAGVLLRAESGAGTLRSAGAVDAIHTDVTDGAEVSALVLGAGIAGTVLEVARLAAVASAVNSVVITAAATAGDPTIAARGSDTDISLALRGKGTGAAILGAATGDCSLGVSTAGIIADSGSDTGATPTVSRSSGIVRVQSGNTEVTVTNALCTVNSKVFPMIRNVTTNAVSVLRAVPGAGSFVVTLSGDPGASHADIAFFMIQPD